MTNKKDIIEPNWDVPESEREPFWDIPEDYKYRNKIIETMRCPYYFHIEGEDGEWMAEKYFKLQIGNTYRYNIEFVNKEVNSSRHILADYLLDTSIKMLRPEPRTTPFIPPEPKEELEKAKKYYESIKEDSKMKKLKEKFIEIPDDYICKNDIIKYCSISDSSWCTIEGINGKWRPVDFIKNFNEDDYRVVFNNIENTDEHFFCAACGLNHNVKIHDSEADVIDEHISSSNDYTKEEDSKMEKETVTIEDLTQVGKLYTIPSICPNTVFEYHEEYDDSIEYTNVIFLHEDNIGVTITLPKSLPNLTSIVKLIDEPGDDIIYPDYSIKPYWYLYNDESSIYKIISTTQGYISILNIKNCQFYFIHRHDFYREFRSLDCLNILLMKDRKYKIKDESYEFEPCGVHYSVDDECYIIRFSHKKQKRDNEYFNTIRSLPLSDIFKEGDSYELNEENIVEVTENIQDKIDKITKPGVIYNIKIPGKLDTKYYTFMERKEDNLSYIDIESRDHLTVLHFSEAIKMVSEVPEPDDCIYPKYYAYRICHLKKENILIQMIRCTQGFVICEECSKVYEPRKLIYIPIFKFYTEVERMSDINDIFTVNKYYIPNNEVETIAPSIDLSSIPDAIFYEPIDVEPSVKYKDKYAIRFKLLEIGSGSVTNIISILIDIDDIKSNKIHLFKCNTPILLDHPNISEDKGE